jgi:hypothetical protein
MSKAKPIQSALQPLYGALSPISEALGRPETGAPSQTSGTRGETTHAV